jgi:hypothetical protein
LHFGKFGSITLNQEGCDRQAFSAVTSPQVCENPTDVQIFKGFLNAGSLILETLPSYPDEPCPKAFFQSDDLQ